MTHPVVFSISGITLQEDEIRFFEEFPPFGFILFGRNVDTPEQLKRLISDLKNIHGTGCPILIDQEGGRVQRLRPPHWRQYECMQNCTDPKKLEETLTRLSQELIEVGVNINCAPVLDVSQPDTDRSIGDRAFSDHPEKVGALGTIACRAFINSGITPVIKHLPGHGRAIVDSHDNLPVVHASIDDLRRNDFQPFQQVLSHPDLEECHGMVGHCLYTDIDRKRPASLSEIVIQDIIRGEIGLRGMLFSDDLSMNALGKYGSVANRAKLSLEAGCDIALYCAGNLDEMKDIAAKIS